MRSPWTRREERKGLEEGRGRRVVMRGEGQGGKVRGFCGVERGAAACVFHTDGVRRTHSRMVLQVAPSSSRVGQGQRTKRRTRNTRTCGRTLSRFRPEHTRAFCIQTVCTAASNLQLKRVHYLPGWVVYYGIASKPFGAKHSAHTAIESEGARSLALAAKELFSSSDSLPHLSAANASRRVSSSFSAQKAPRFSSTKIENEFRAPSCEDASSVRFERRATFSNFLSHSARCSWLNCARKTVKTEFLEEMRPFRAQNRPLPISCRAASHSPHQGPPLPFPCKTQPSISPPKMDRKRNGAGKTCLRRACSVQTRRRMIVASLLQYPSNSSKWCPTSLLAPVHLSFLLSLAPRRHAVTARTQFSDWHGKISPRA